MPISEAIDSKCLLNIRQPYNLTISSAFTTCQCNRLISNDTSITFKSILRNAFNGTRNDKLTYHPKLYSALFESWESNTFTELTHYTENLLCHNIRGLAPSYIYII